MEMSLQQQNNRVYEWMQRNRFLTWGGIFVGGVVIYVVSGGFPPSSWRLLFQLLPRTGTLWITRGSAFLFPFVILLVQSLLLAAAWVVLLWLSIRETFALLQSPARSTTASSPLPVAGRQAGIAQPTTLTVPSPAYEDEDDDDDTLEHLDDNEEDEADEYDEEDEYDEDEDEEDEEDDAFLDDPFSDEAFEKGSSHGHMWVYEDELDEMRGQQRRARLEEVEGVDTLGGLLVPSSPSFAPTIEEEQDEQVDSFEEWMQASRPVPVPSRALKEKEDERDTLPAVDAIKDVVDASPARPSRSTLRADVVSHTGLVRASRPNEDSALLLLTIRKEQSGLRTPQTVGLFLVADGVGGHEHGKYASSFVVDAMRADLEASLRNPEKRGRDLKGELVAAVKRANSRLFAENSTINALRGTTLTGVLLIEEPSHDLLTYESAPYSAYIVNVGDSRTYWYSTTQGVQRITRDHSLVEDLIATNVITPEERYTDSRRNEIYRCLGNEQDVEVDVFSITPHSGDRLLLCSDGLWEMVHEDELASLLTLQTDDPALVTNRMLQAALDSGGRDNITALVVFLTSEED